MFKRAASIPENWHVLTGTDDIRQAIEKSFKKPVFIFKHSTRCGLSAFAKSELENWHKEGSQNTDIYYLDLIAHRSTSNEISLTFETPHQSPQIIALVLGKSIGSISHSSINSNDLDSLQKRSEGLLNNEH